MFDKIAQLAGVMKALPKVQEEVERFQQRVGQIIAEGDAGAGMVKIRVNGRGEVVVCSISDEVFKTGDREMLEDLVRAATNQAYERMRSLVRDESKSMASNLGLPAGLGLPGLD
jgi:DNA-binding YbaB/EbfC family protein